MDAGLKEIQSEEMGTKKPRMENNTTIYVDEVASSQSDIPPGEMVASIDLLLSMILQAMPDYDLLHNIRLVNFRWYSVATKILHGRFDVTTITFNYNKDRSCFIRVDGEGSDSENTLQSFTTLLNNSQTPEFPVTQFIFNDGFLLAPDLQEFFNLHGPLVFKLTLDLTSDEHGEIGMRFLHLASFTKLLTVQVPNLRHLKLEQWQGRIPFASQNASAFITLPKMFPVTDEISHLLPKLKVLNLARVDVLPQQIVELLQASINLNRIVVSEITLPLVNCLVQSNRVSLLHRCVFFCTEFNIEAYEKLADAKLTLKKFEVNLNTTFDEVDSPFNLRMARCLEKILGSTSESLEKLTWSTAGHLPSLVIPPMKNVENLVFTDYSNGIHNYFHDENGDLPPTVPLFPPGAPSFSSIFPNLVHVKFSTLYRFEDRLMIMNGDDMFSQPLLTVQTLDIVRMTNFSPEMISKLAQMFPNVTHARFRGIGNFPLVAKSIWKFLKLKHIDLQIRAFSTNNQNPALDLAFTGFSPGTVRMLRVMSEDEIGQNLDTELLRENPSIVDLKDLESLSIKLFDSEEGDPGDLLITRLSLDHAFRLIPKLRVFIGIYTDGREENYNKIKHSLREMESNAKYQPQEHGETIVLYNEDSSAARIIFER